MQKFMKILLKFDEILTKFRQNFAKKWWVRSFFFLNGREPRCAASRMQRVSWPLAGQPDARDGNGVEPRLRQG